MPYGPRNGGLQVHLRRTIWRVNSPSRSDLSFGCNAARGSPLAAAVLPTCVRPYSGTSSPARHPEAQVGASQTSDSQLQNGDDGGPSFTSRQGRRPERRTLSTLHPARLRPSDFIDIAGMRNYAQIMVPPAETGQLPAGTEWFNYMRVWTLRDSWHDNCFPSNARGFLYYHRASNAPPLSGAIRLRVTEEPDPALFPHGKDLLRDDGTVWSVPLLRMVRWHNYAPALPLLLRDGLVSAEELKHAAAMAAVHLHLRQVHAFGQPFSILFGGQPRLLFIGWDTVQPALPSRTCLGTLPISLNHGPGPKGHSAKAFLSGSLVASYEKSTLPEHAGHRVVVCRVHRIVDPVKILPGAPLYLQDQEFLLPRPGELLQFLPSGKRIKKSDTWSMNVDKRLASGSSVLAKGLSLLYDNEERAGGPVGW
ncbi:hypothetical protein OH77DRAFT_1430207 [Trametes cingulata]|nr:hypothetical protein OH77DRAFT_1430207 [Trametes cingulata]